MEKMIYAIIALLIYPIVYVSVGALSGFVVSLFFDQTIHQTVYMLTNSLRFSQVQLWEFGATAGFFAAWFKPISYTKEHD